jgi:hypothetical protein
MKKLTNKKVNLFGKKVPVFAIVLLGIGLVTAALLPYFGQITGSAVVNQGLLVDGQVYSDGVIDDTYANFTSLQAMTFVSAHSLENNADVEANVSLDMNCSGKSCEDEGFTYKTVEYFDEAGARTGEEYSVDTSQCDVNVSTDNELQTNLSNTDNQVICVEVGTYNSFTVSSGSTNVEIVSLAGPDSTTIDADNSDYGVEVTSGSSVTIRGFTIKNYNKNGIHAVGANIVVKDNIIQGSTRDYSLDSIYTKGGTTATIEHNNLLNNKYSGNAGIGTIDWSTSAGVSVHDGDVVTANYNNISGNDFGIHVKYEGNDSTSLTAVSNNIVNNSVDAAAENATDDSIPYEGSTTIATTSDNWFGTNGINTLGNVGASYKVKGPTVTVPAGETDTFGILVEFPKMTYPDTYEVTTTVNAA